MESSFEDLRKEVGQAIRARREDRSMTQEDVAYKADLSVRHFYQIETGAANPTLRTLHAIALALNVSIKDLIEQRR